MGLMLICQWAIAQSNIAIQPPLAVSKNTLEFHALNQVWVRSGENNLGTTVLSEAATHSFDIGLRRTRFQVFGEVAPGVFLYFQAGQNNFNRLSGLNGNRKTAFFIHDAVCEYAAVGSKLKLGGGLTIANGLSRYSQPSIASILALDVPVFAQTTVDQTDQFSRKLSFYARGQIGKWDYRAVLSDPFPIQSNGIIQPNIGPNSTFALKGHHIQYQGLLTYQFLEKESNVTPYMQGTYLGKKKVLNVSAGVIYQKRATWRNQTNANLSVDTIYSNMIMICGEVFLDKPINIKKGNAIHAYVGVFFTQYGENYLRFNGIMNPADGTNLVGLAKDVGSQYGNAYPMFGTGKVFYAQEAYLFPLNTLGDNGEHGQLQLYATQGLSKYDRLNGSSLITASLGVNWLMPGNKSKITLDLTSRPSVQLFADGIVNQQKKSTITVQYQINI